MPRSTLPMVEEHVHGETVWVAVRARGADWSWLTPEEAVRIGRQWIEKYGSPAANQSGSEGIARLAGNAAGACRDNQETESSLSDICASD
jgi:hypothetical protein